MVPLGLIGAMCSPIVGGGRVESGRMGQEFSMAAQNTFIFAAG